MSTSKSPAKLPTQGSKQGGAASKAGSTAAPSAAGSVLGDDPAKAVERLETKTKAVYVTLPIRFNDLGSLTYQSSNSNNIARVANSQLTSNDEKLQPLMSLKTGKPLEKFPEKSKDIEKLSLTLIDSMLNGLEADRTGSEATKRERLRVQIGLKPHPA